MINEKGIFFKENPMEREIIIPEDEFEITFSRSSGHGGQNVNKVSTKATLKWNIFTSRVLNDDEKSILLDVYSNKIDNDGNFIIYSQSERSQFKNKQDVIEKLHEMVRAALKPEKERIPTKIPKSVREKRLQGKKEQSEKKKLRQKPIETD